jgi:hypothetical protein
VRYGPTSLWTHKRPAHERSNTQTQNDTLPGDWVNWSNNLPTGFGVTRQIHDQALGLFASYYGAWGVTVDFPAFLKDLNSCNLVRPSGWEDEHPPARTAHYSPLLHCCVLYLGITFMRSDFPEIVGALDSAFWDHTSKLLLKECDQASLGSLRGYNLLAK